MLTLNSSQLPSRLLQLPQSPLKLHVIGAELEHLLSAPCIAVVGSRKVTPYGRNITRQLVTELTSKGIAIISGLALGVDSIAHQACLDSGGKTIAVQPCGPERIYPAAHTNLARIIVESGGAVVTEYDEGVEPFPSNFLARNRIIAGLADAVLITEAAARSGSLNTANHALELGKPVFAVPGNITSPMSAGCNNLIKAGAIPVTSIDDILNVLGWEVLDEKKPRVTSDSPNEQLIIELLYKGISDGVELLGKSGLTAGSFNQSLTMLEITGKVRPLGANHWAI